MIKEKIIENVGIIYLDRPKQINALNFETIKGIRKILDKWKDNDSIKAVLFDSFSDKGFCAGGDLKEIYNEFLINDDCADKDRFFKIEFDLDKYVKNYKKPIISHWYGVTMGGGIGLTINSNFIITDETVNWAMPETSLGFVPDVGVCKYISSLPQALGQYVGLCGVSLESSDLIEYNLADVYINSKDYEKLITKLYDLSKNYEGDQLIENLNKEAKKWEVKDSESEIDKNIDKINKYFSHSSLNEIFEDLKDNTDDEFAKKCYYTLKERDPFMLTIQFEKYFVCKELSYEETIDLDLRIIQYAINKNSIKEGIRAKIIDKDNNPSWPCRSLDDISIEEVKDLLSIDKAYEER
ncbi:enoyl-CoA hydratase/isomerase family protein [Anaerococcus sp.]|uniref:enoyl-CoA hydratase/isomerase family protein n=1 Tax=Anaerococcus sp. TaxID=1872515 RepID=UPI002905104B|nr:enoyl-CoA hydratase/isomerase family protein [Anaerococcus sp.]MDU2566414.1 enoyl-CoA hydratase/isomerase family protein [Anaerococcus sp.]MDU2599770.1 enoyl-CoA hydratase/isomerase family protein [Anaerococcus sp.]